MLWQKLHYFATVHAQFLARSLPPPPQVWDEQLSYLSQYWAVRCEYILNENRHEQDSNYDYVGENIAGSANYTTNLTAMVFNWYFEGRLYDYSTAACTDDDGNEEEEGCESYTQVYT